MKIGCEIVRFGSVTSTNDAAKELAAEGAPEGTVVVAAEQTKGRGSRGRSWVSPPGVNLYASIILRPSIRPERYGELAFVAAIAAARALRSRWELETRIKWPNDVRVRRRKIAGTLVEVANRAAIVGIGINVNWTDIPREIAPTSTSIQLERKLPADIDEVLRVLVADLDLAYLTYIGFGFESILRDWMKYQDTIGRRITVELGGESITGMALGVDGAGGLRIELEGGEVRTVSAGIIVDQDL